MKISETLEIGHLYSRNELIETFQIVDATVNTGIFIPKGYNSILLFITKEKTSDRPQYQDNLNGNTLYWESQPTGRKDTLIREHEKNGYEVLVFYREKKDQYDGYAFRYEGPFRYKSHEETKPVRFILERIEPLVSSRADERNLYLVSNIDQIRSSLRRFNRDVTIFPDLSRSLARHTKYWVYDPDEATFGPSKFVGYQSMTFDRYKLAKNDETTGVPFNGGLTHTAIANVLGKQYEKNILLFKRFISWGKNIWGEDVFEEIYNEKWQFLSLPQQRHYWAFFANPKIYDIERAIKELEEDDWSSKGKDVQKGDFVFICRGVKDGKRGIVALAEVISSPEIKPPSQECMRYFLTDEQQDPQERVRIRYSVPADLPLWLEEDSSGLLNKLSVFKARGGTVFYVEPELWHDIVGLLRGVKEEGYLEETLEELNRKIKKKGCGQGITIDPEFRKAMELHSMRLAEEHFLELGYEVEDVSKNQPYDLRCSFGNEQLFVEVKSTQSSGEEVLLTPNEVLHAEANPDKMVLFIVHSLKVKKDEQGKVVVSGENKEILKPWDINHGILKPLGYSFRMK